MKVTVIIPTLQKNYEYLMKCVDSLRAAEVSEFWDIIVVSNGGPHQMWPEGKYRRLHTNQQGQCVAVNIGAQTVSPDTDYIMVCNDDMYFAPDWGKELRFDYPVFSPNLIEPVEIGSAPPFEKLDGGTDLETFKQDVVDEFVKNYEADVPETTGFNLPFFIKKEVWETIGGYDTKYDPWGSNSDTDLQTLIELAGIQPIRLRDVLVYHFGSKSESFTGDKQTFWQKNFDYYTRKFGFNRDMEPQADTWMAQGMVLHDKLTFHPVWEGKYSEKE